LKISEVEKTSLQKQIAELNLKSVPALDMNTIMKTVRLANPFSGIVALPGARAATCRVCGKDFSSSVFSPDTCIDCLLKSAMSAFPSPAKRQK
jgi:hypothetical protein